jgi:hypothetical protein
VGVTALDDVSLTSGDCPDRASCSFEAGDLCAWRNVPAEDSVDTADWMLTAGNNKSLFPL